MKLYRREVKYQWYGWNDRGSAPLEDETEWMPEEEAEKLGIEIYHNTFERAVERERFIFVKEVE